MLCIMLKVGVGSPGLTVARRYANSDGMIFEAVPADIVVYQL